MPDAGQIAQPLELVAGAGVGRGRGPARWRLALMMVAGARRPADRPAARAGAGAPSRWWPVPGTSPRAGGGDRPIRGRGGQIPTKPAEPRPVFHSCRVFLLTSEFFEALFSFSFFCVGGCDVFAEDRVNPPEKGVFFFAAPARL